MPEKFKLACGSNSEFFWHNANFRKLSVTTPPADVPPTNYFFRCLLAVPVNSLAMELFCIVIPLRRSAILPGGLFMS